MFKAVSAGLTGPHVPNTAFGSMLRTFWCNDSSTALRTLSDWSFTHRGLLTVPGQRNFYLQNQARLSKPYQLLLRDLSDSSATESRRTSPAAEAFAQAVRVQKKFLNQRVIEATRYGRIVARKVLTERRAPSPHHCRSSAEAY